MNESSVQLFSTLRNTVVIVMKLEADVAHGGRLLSLLTVRWKKKTASSVEDLGPQLSLEPGNVSHEPRTGSSVSDS